MKRAWIALLAGACVMGAQTAAAQVTVESSASVQVNVTVDVSASVELSASSPIAHPPIAAPSGEPPSLALTPLIHLRAEMGLVGGDYDFAAWGGSVLLGADAGAGWSGGLVLGYVAEVGGDLSEVDLALEVAKDFSPLETLGFVLVARVGTAFMLDGAEPRGELDSGIRVIGQLGVGMRLSFDPRIALTLDLRGLFRHAPGGNADVDLVGGAAITMGLAMHID